MEPSPSTGIDNIKASPGLDLWESFENHRASAFVVAGGLSIARFVVPVGIPVLTDWAWAPGSLLIGFAVIGAAVGLFGLYPQTTERAPRLAFMGAISTGIATVTGLIMVVGTGIILFFGPGSGTNASMPVEIFIVVALSMSGGFSLGFVLFGIAVRRISSISSRVGYLLVGGGLLHLLPVVVESLGFVSSLSTSPWILFSILGVVAIDMLVIGHFLQRGVTEES